MIDGVLGGRGEGPLGRGYLVQKWAIGVICPWGGVVYDRGALRVRLYIGTKAAMVVEGEGGGGREAEERGRDVEDSVVTTFVITSKKMLLSWARFCAWGAVLLIACTVWVASQSGSRIGDGLDADILLGEAVRSGLRGEAKNVAQKLYEAELDLAKDGFKSKQKLAKLRSLQRQAVHLAAELKVQRKNLSVNPRAVSQGNLNLGRQQMLASTSLTGDDLGGSVPVKEILRLNDLGSLVNEIRKSRGGGKAGAQVNPININIYIPQYPSASPARSAVVSQTGAVQDELEKQNQQIQGILKSMQQSSSRTARLSQTEAQMINRADDEEAQEPGVADPLASTELKQSLASAKPPAGKVHSSKEDALIRKMKMDGMILNQPGRVQSLSSVSSKETMIDSHPKLSSSASPLSLSSKLAANVQVGSSDEQFSSLAMNSLPRTASISPSDLRRSARDKFRSLLNAAGDAEKMKITGSLGDLLPDSIMNAERKRNVIFEMNEPKVKAAKVRDKLVLLPPLSHTLSGPCRATGTAFITSGDPTVGAARSSST
eukprot:765655-Hanusia_phi.AAC.3